MRRLLPFVLLLVALIAAAPAHAAPALGIYAEDAADTDGGAEALQGEAGLGVVRMPWIWREIETSPGRFDWRRTDRAMDAASRHGLTVLPFLVDAPSWATGVDPALGDAYPPTDPAAMQRFATAAVQRYGPDGRFWKLGGWYYPIRVWQVWNEPNTPAFWPTGPNPAAYTALLRATGDAIHAADPGATVLSAGLPDSEIGIRLVPFLRGMYAAGALGAFDALGVHGYAPDPASAVGVVARARAVMTQAGDTRPIWVSEFGYASGGEDSMVTTDEAGQARLLGQTALALRTAARPLGVAGLIAFRWRDATPPSHLRDLWPFHSGVIRTDGSPKPSLGALAAGFGAPVVEGPAAPGTLRVKAKVLTDRAASGRRGVRLRIRCSRACRAGIVLLARQPRPGRGPLRHVSGRFDRTLPGAKVRTITLRPIGAERAWLAAHPKASQKLLLTAVTASGAVATVERKVPARISRSSRRTSRR